MHVCYGYQKGELSCVCMLRISGRRAIVCMHATDIRMERYHVHLYMCATDIRSKSYHVHVCYGYHEGELCMLPLSGGRAITCLYATNIRREIYHLYVCYGYQEGEHSVYVCYVYQKGELACVCMLRIS